MEVVDYFFDIFYSTAFVSGKFNKPYKSFLVIDRFKLLVVVWPFSGCMAF